MKQKTRWRIKGDADDAWIDDRTEAERALATKCFDKAFAEVRHTEVLASIPPKNLSASLMTSLKLAGNHARNHPAILIPAVCKAVEAEHLPVFKRQGKLFTGPARPHPLPLGATLAERPGIMVEWIRANKPAKLEGLWKAVLPEGATAPPAEFAADLFWLLHQGHILLFTDDTLVVQEVREAQGPDTDAEPKAGKKKKKKNKKAKPEGSTAPGESPADEEQTGEEPSVETTQEEAPEESPAAEAATVEETAPEIPADPIPQEDAPAVAETVEESPAAAAAIEETAPETPADPAPQEETPAPAASESEAAEELSKKPAAGVDDSPGL